MGSIVVLDDSTINKIAAGEVVDRPASIVKELVENSIDAGAKNITVEIKKGGIDYIKIVDDGSGFRADDTEIAFERHATSKIRKEADILKITSMGFRGEALASIAAIAKVTLITKHIDEQLGTKVEVEGGNIVSSGVAPSNQGTTIIVRDVFYNTPARYKFLKKDFTEAGYIEDVITRIALAYPSISIKYINSGKTVITTTGDGKLENVIYSIFGRDVYTNIIPIDYEYEDKKVKGAIGLPSISRSSRSYEFTFINSRFVKDKVLMSAIEKGYDEKLMINKFPFAIINLFMNPENLDVNVHPAKLEVKFENENKVFEAVYYAVKNALENENKKTSPFTILKDKKENIESGTDILPVNEEVVNESKAEIEEGVKVPEFDVSDFTNKPKENDFSNLTKAEENVSSEFLKLVKDLNVNTDDEIAVNEEKEEYKAEEKNESIFKADEYEEESVIEKEEKDKVLYKYVGYAFNTYIIIELDGKVYFIDQHAAHERIMYDRVKEYFEAKEKESQMLLIPEVIELRTQEMQIVRDNIEFFEKYGYILEEFSESSYKISGIPNIGDIKLNYRDIFMDIVDEFMVGVKSQRQQNQYRFLATIACKAAVKGNIAISKEEQINLIDGMLASSSPFTCAHGRPTAIEFSRYEIEKKFGRVQM